MSTPENTTTSLATILNDHIVAPIKKRFGVLEQNGSVQAKTIEDLKQKLSESHAQIDELQKQLGEAQLLLKKHSEDLENQLQKLTAQIEAMALANSKIDKNQRRQQEFEEALSNIAWEE